MNALNRRSANNLVLLAALGADWPSASAQPNQALSISIENSGRYALDGKPVEQAQLLAAIKTASGGRAFDLTISMAAQAKYESVGRVIAAAHEAGVSAVRLVTVAPPDSAASQAK